mmetsp:Transcript_15463/g.32083  ORF Transcript_15463/g.32083 Transcript_15463/m.32083 type:complete len:96 (-) Transcript_15463:583-870(-)
MPYRAVSYNISNIVALSFFQGRKNAFLRLSMTSTDFSSINCFTFVGTFEVTDPAPEQTWILVAVSGSKYALALLNNTVAVIGKGNNMHLDKRSGK